MGMFYGKDTAKKKSMLTMMTINTYSMKRNLPTDLNHDTQFLLFSPHFCPLLLAWFGSGIETSFCACFIDTSFSWEFVCFFLWFEYLAKVTYSIGGRKWPQGRERLERNGRKKEGRKDEKRKERKEETRPSRPIRCDVWIVERMRYPTDQPTDRPTNQRTQPVIEVLCRT